MVRRSILLALIVLRSFAGPAFAQAPMPTDHVMPAAPAQAAGGVPEPGTDNAAAAAYRRANEAMMHRMAAAPTGDADHDFVTGMLPHHQGAVDMAKIELQHGKDPVLRRLARGIIAAQEKEMRLMRDWLARHPAKP